MRNQNIWEYDSISSNFLIFVSLFFLFHSIPGDLLSSVKRFGDRGHPFLVSNLREEILSYFTIKYNVGYHLFVDIF